MSAWHWYPSSGWGMLYFSIDAHINVSGTVQSRYKQAGTAINEKNWIYSITPSMWGGGKEGIRFPNIAAFPLCSRTPRRPQRWWTASPSSCPVWRPSAAPSFLTSRSPAKWQKGWSLLEDGNGDQMGEYLRKKYEEKSPTKRKLQIFSRRQHYLIRGTDFMTNLYIQFVYTIGTFCTLLKIFVHYTILSVQEWAPWMSQKYPKCWFVQKQA